MKRKYPRYGDPMGRADCINKSQVCRSPYCCAQFQCCFDRKTPDEQNKMVGGGEVKK